MAAHLSGEVRRLPASLPIRIFQAVSLWTLMRSAFGGASRFLLGYRQHFELTGRERQLELHKESRIWGKAVSSTQSVLPVDRLQEITLEKTGESPSFSAGLVSLCLGSFLGFRLIAEGALAGAFSLLSWGALLAALGIAFDFFLGSGRTVQAPLGRVQLVLRVQGERGWVLSCLNPERAQATLEMVQRALASDSALAFAEPQAPSPPEPSPLENQGEGSSPSEEPRPEESPKGSDS